MSRGTLVVAWAIHVCAIVVLASVLIHGPSFTHSPGVLPLGITALVALAISGRAIRRGTRNVKRTVVVLLLLALGIFAFEAQHGVAYGVLLFAGKPFGVRN